MVISVPKRLLRLAVRRNTVKRIARESWRHAAAADRARLQPPGILVRLIRVPTAPADGVGGDAPSGSRAGRRAARTAGPVVQALPLATFKRLLRLDLDAIWAGRFRPTSRAGRPSRAAPS